MTDRDFEQVVLCRDPGTGLESVIAIHDTTLGPSLGGTLQRAAVERRGTVAVAVALAQARLTQRRGQRPNFTTR
jgi:leucine dehydrogenase